MPVATFVATIVAPGTTAPEGSKIVPWIEPEPPIWASASVGAARSARHRMHRTAEFAFMSYLQQRIETTPPAARRDSLVFGQDLIPGGRVQARKPARSRF